MSDQLTRDHLKEFNSITRKLSDFIVLISDFRRLMIIPPKLLDLSRQSTVQVHIFKNLNAAEVQENHLIIDSRIVLESIFAVSEKSLIQDLFNNICESSNVSMISLSNNSDKTLSVIATSIFSMCDDGCYISYVAVVERDIFGITEKGYFWDCGIARFLVCVIQLLTYMNFASWNVYCWSNNSKRKKDMWTKLGFEVLQSGVNGLWPSSIEDLAVYFHLPSEHALKSKLIPKGIKSSIFSFDVTKDLKNLFDIHCPSHILSLQYYKDSWFDYSAIEQELSDLDTRKQCITWMRSNFDFQDIPANNSSIADMISYIFLNRLKLMIDTVTVSSAGDDLREISDEEGYMSEIAMDYCMMSMFFHVNNIYPIHTQVFATWDRTLCYYSLKSELSSFYKFTDCDIMECQAENQDFIFIIPYFRDSHYQTIVRRWIDGKIYFLYNDSLYKSQRKVFSVSTTYVPYESFAFLMNSPLWPEGSTAYWVRIPSIQQEDDECGFRTLLHSYIMVNSKYPLHCLLPLNYFGKKSSTNKNHSLYKYHNTELPKVCRSWVKDIMYSKKWKSPQWVEDVLSYNMKSYTSTIKDTYCLIFKCTTESEEEVKSIVRRERGVCKSGSVEKEAICTETFDQVFLRKNAVEPADTALEMDSSTSGVLCQNTIHDNVSSTSCVHNGDDIVNDADDNIVPTELLDCVRNDTIVSNELLDSVRNLSIEKETIISSVEGTSFTDYGSTSEEISNCSRSSSEDSTITAPWRNTLANTIVIVTDNTRLTRVDCVPASEVHDDKFDFFEPGILDDGMLVPLVEQPSSTITKLSNKKPRKNQKSTLTSTDVIDVICIVCDRPVTKKFECNECSNYIHQVCGFMKQDGKLCCSECYNYIDSDTLGSQRRLRRDTIKDTDLSLSWSVQHTVRRNKDVVPVPNSSRVPQLTREQKTKLFNLWLTNIKYIMCKQKNKTEFTFYGCHDEFKNVQEIYSKYIQETLLVNERELLDQLRSKEFLNKWCILPTSVLRLIQLRGDVFSNEDKFISFDTLEQHEWSYMKFSTFDGRREIGNYSLVDTEEDLEANTFHISLTDSNKQRFVRFVPKYYIYRWHRFCDLYKSSNQENEFSNIFIKARRYANQWVRLDAGRFRYSSNIINIARNRNVPKCPLIYRVQSVGESSCVFSSLISAMHYINDHQSRDLLMDKLPNSLSATCLAAEECINRESYAAVLLNKHGKYQSLNMKNFNILSDHSIWPTLCILKGSDGSISHSITVVENFIFDSSVGRAMELTRQNLDWCCGSDYQDVYFVCIEKAYRFINTNASTQILIRRKKDICKSIKSFIKLFYFLQEPEVCLKLEKYLENFSMGEDFMTAILNILFRKPHLYLSRRIKEKNLNVLLNKKSQHPMVLLLTNQNNSFRLITVYKNLFFDGSQNPGFPFSESVLATVLNWENTLWKDINIVRGYLFIKSNYKK